MGSRSCGLCPAVKDLLRCSRCKIQWYCGPEHQRQHWEVHKKTCAPPTPEQEEDRKRKEHQHHLATQAYYAKQEQGQDIKPKREDLDDCIEGDTLLSLMCPLSISRIEIPAKGVNCDHTRCFDLETFLQFSEQSWTWQCPLCYIALHYKDIIVDQRMMEILRETPRDIEQVRLKPGGGYTIVQPTTVEEREQLRAQKKRKAVSPTPPQRSLLAPQLPQPTPAPSWASSNGTSPRQPAAPSTPSSSNQADEVIIIDD
jgi:hypothetical protein